MITHAGATVKFFATLTASPLPFTIDPAVIEVAITPRTVGIIPVHLYGQPADLEAITSIASTRSGIRSATRWRLILRQQGAELNQLFDCETAQALFFLFQMFAETGREQQ